MDMALWRGSKVGELPSWKLGLELFNFVQNFQRFALAFRKDTKPQ
jgi:hypothetical protein